MCAVNLTEMNGRHTSVQEPSRAQISLHKHEHKHVNLSSSQTSHTPSQGESSLVLIDLYKFIFKFFASMFRSNLTEMRVDCLGDRSAVASQSQSDICTDYAASLSTRAYRHSFFHQHHTSSRPQPHPCSRDGPSTWSRDRSSISVVHMW